MKIHLIPLSVFLVFTSMAMAANTPHPTLKDSMAQADHSKVVGTEVNVNLPIQQAGETFEETLYTSRVSGVTDIEFVPDGRLFVLEQAGRLRIIKMAR